MEISEFHPFKSAKLRDSFLKEYDQRAENWPVPSETKMIDTPYGRTFVRICGPENAKPLVLLHGAGANSLMWIPSVEALSAHFRIYAIDDLYGRGRSISARAIKDSSSYTDWLNDLFNALELGNDISLMGASYGGWQVSQYALRFPERLNKIVLIAPGATVLPLPIANLARLLLAFLFPRYLGRYLLWLFTDWAKKDKPAMDAFIQNFLSASRCFKFRLMPKPTVLTDSELKHITLPTLFLVGANEKTFTAQAAVKRLNTVAPQIKTEIVPNAGHDLISVQTEMVNRKVLEFLTGSAHR